MLCWKVTSSPVIVAQSTDAALLRSADSLFANRQYTEAFGQYEQLFAQQKEVSSALLLKMAFIQESTGDYSEALYYLNEYYLLTSDEAAVQKMQQLSEQHNLRGYAYTDYQLFYNYLREYRYYVIYGLIALVMLGLIFLVLSRKRETRLGQAARPYGWGIACLLVLGLLWYMTNASLEPRQAIIMEDHTYIMAAPSSGAEVVYIGEKGHRVPIGKQEDVWTQIEWDGKPAYVRRGNLREIDL
jgi:hypothetical protein